MVENISAARWIALLGALAFAIGACASKNLAPDPAEVEQEVAAARAAELDLVRATIADPGRAGRLVELVAERDDIVERFAGTLAAHKERMARLNADYESERGDFEAALADFNRERIVAQVRMVELITEMKQATTADEWDVIAEFQQKRLRPRDLAFRGSAGGVK
jgi:hypothetical protein